MLARSALLRVGSYRGPPGDAAEICAATPRLSAFAGSRCGPDSCARQAGFEHWPPARMARERLSDSEKSSRTWSWCRLLGAAHATRRTRRMAWKMRFAASTSGSRPLWPVARAEIQLTASTT